MSTWKSSMQCPLSLQRPVCNKLPLSLLCPHGVVVEERVEPDGRNALQATPRRDVNPLRPDVFAEPPVDAPMVGPEQGVAAAHGKTHAQLREPHVVSLLQANVYRGVPGAAVAEAQPRGRADHPQPGQVLARQPAQRDELALDALHRRGLLGLQYPDRPRAALEGSASAAVGWLGGTGRQRQEVLHLLLRQQARLRDHLRVTEAAESAARFLGGVGKVADLDQRGFVQGDVLARPEHGPEVRVVEEAVHAVLRAPARRPACVQHPAVLLAARQRVGPDDSGAAARPEA
mmetsp:Transcript_73252/g.191166  ORF Transcript_73252/g.191166 Transcript_73252/m.191166 type:complete len:288 (-) Transcript_73252:592-1455(-)